MRDPTREGEITDAPVEVERLNVHPVWTVRTPGEHEVSPGYSMYDDATLQAGMSGPDAISVTLPFRNPSGQSTFAS
jgi:hypothetical protein